MREKNSDTATLVARRKAAWVLNELCRQAELGTMAIRFDPSDPSEWATIDEREVRAIKGGRLLAEVELERDKAIVVLMNPTNLVRGKHIRDFIPEDHGFEPPAYDGMGNQEPYVITIGLPDDIPGLNLAPVIMPRSQRVRKHKVVGRV